VQPIAPRALIDPHHEPVVILTRADVVGAEIPGLQFDDDAPWEHDAGPVVPHRDLHATAARKVEPLPGTMPFGFWFAPGVAIGDAMRPMPRDDRAALGN